jgi:hypothetical protein
MGQIKLFSNYFRKKREKDPEFFQKRNITAAYLTGAYSSAIIESSWDGVFKEKQGERVQISRVKENDTFKKWLSNQQITFKNLLNIANKAAYFQRKFNLDSAINNDLSTLVTENLNPYHDEISLDQEISFAFLRGFNDFRTFKYTKQGEA